MKDLITISQLRGITFYIPSHQRGYRWREENVQALLDDFKEFLEQAESGISSRVYCLQPLAVTPKSENTYSVEDGQQRLTTIYLLIKYLFGNNDDFYSFVFESDPDERRQHFLEKDVVRENYSLQSDINFYHLGWAYDTIKLWFSSKDQGLGYEEKFRELLNAGENEDSLQFIWYEISEDKARKVFRDLNYGKIRLTCSDLIKALLLSRDNGLTEEQRIVISTQLDEMTHCLSDDRFWFVFQHHNPLYHSDRLDFLFNLTEKVNEDEYKHYPYQAFKNFVAAKNKNALYDEWLKTRKTYHVLRDLYENPFVYHYLGYLVYISNQTSQSSFTLYEWINNYHHQSMKKTQFVTELRESIRTKLALSEEDLEKLQYSERAKVRNILLLHNIETLLSHYRTMRERLGIQQIYEQFPFDLLHRQSWDIEHLASQTDNPLQSEREWNDWLESTMSDNPDLFKSSMSGEITESGEEREEKEENPIVVKYRKYTAHPKGSRSKDLFKDLYKEVLNTIEKDLGEEKVTFKDGLGNLVLLDSHTNRSFHNSLYPRKRKIILESQAYIPICTRQVFTKFYNTNPFIKMNAWTKSDFDSYMKDLRNKLSYYLTIEK